MTDTEKSLRHATADSPRCRFCRNLLGWPIEGGGMACTPSHAEAALEEMGPVAPRPGPAALPREPVELCKHQIHWRACDQCCPSVPPLAALPRQGAQELPGTCKRCGYGPFKATTPNGLCKWCYLGYPVDLVRGARGEAPETQCTIWCDPAKGQHIDECPGPRAAPTAGAEEPPRGPPKEKAVIEFAPFPKIARLSREVVVTEKLDGTNAQVHITEAGEIMAGSRTRWITPDNDNYGFALWVARNREELLKLGPGSHYGEWWGQGIQRRYGLTEKRFSLFNVHRWGDEAVRPACCHVVPVLYRGEFDTKWIGDVLGGLIEKGSAASPGFMKPEGIVIFHAASGQLFKKTIEKDSEPKSLAAATSGPAGGGADGE